jgi:transcriptional regulator with XRE-family HTH domain
MENSHKQARAARSLLGLHLADVARGSGISAMQISNFERGKRSLHAGTRDKLFAFYARSGLEFTNNNGVREAGIMTRQYSGDAEFRAFYNHLFETARDQGGDICLFNGVPRKLIQHLGKEWYLHHVKRMTEIKDKFRFRVIIAEGDNDFIGSDFVEYRWFPKELFNEKTLYIYGHNVAFFSFDNSDVRVVVIEHPEVAASQRVLFDLAWEGMAKPVPGHEHVSKDTFRN